MAEEETEKEDLQNLMVDLAEGAVLAQKALLEEVVVALAIEVAQTIDPIEDLQISSLADSEEDVEKDKLSE